MLGAKVRIREDAANVPSSWKKEVGIVTQVLRRGNFWADFCGTELMLHNSEVDILETYPDRMRAVL